MMKMQGEYIKDRWIVKMIQELCEQKGIAFSSWSDDWILELQKDDKIHRVIGYRFGLNDSVSASISQDKVATYTILKAKGIAATQHELVRTKVSALNKQVFGDWGSVVIKPLVGTSGHGVYKFDGVDDAVDHIESSTIQAWAASPYIDIVSETRVILLDGTPLLCYKKQPVQINGLNMFNLGLGATAVDTIPDSDLLRLAQSAQLALGLRLAAVDVIETQDGRRSILEINDAVMTEHYSRQSAANAMRAKSVYGAIIDRLFTS